MQLKFRFSILSIFAGFALAIAPASATTITTYSDPASWETATATGYQTVTFTGLATAGNSTSYDSATGVTASGVDFIGYSSSGVSDIQVVDSSAFSWYNDGTGDALIESASPMTSSSPLPYINIILPANVTALSMDLWTTNNPAMSYSITVAGNTYTVPTVGGNTETFWGITSDTPITSIQLDVPAATPSSGTEALLDNFDFGFGATGSDDLSAAPEAGTYLLIGSGLIGLVILRKRMKPGMTITEL